MGVVVPINVNQNFFSLLYLYFFFFLSSLSFVFQNFIRCVQDERYSAMESLRFNLADYTLQEDVSYLSVWGVCANYCYNYKYYSVTPQEYSRRYGPKIPLAQTKYKCNCKNKLQFNVEGRTSRYAANEEWATPSFNCIDSTSGRMAGRYQYVSQSYSSSLVQTFAQFQTYKFNSCNQIDDSSSSLRQVKNVASIGACSDACEITSNISRFHPHIFGLSGRTCFCYDGNYPTSSET